MASLALEYAARYILIGPDGSRCVFNDSTDADFVGVLNPESSGLDSPEVREDAQDLTEEDGGLHGKFFYGRRPVVLQGTVIATSKSDRSAKIAKIKKATNALRADAGLFWTPSGNEEVFLSLRRQQPVRFTKGYVKDFFLPMVSASASILSVAWVTGSKFAEANSSPTTKFAGKGEKATKEGVNEWQNPENIKVSDNVYARRFMSEENSEFLYAKSFGYAIPSTATILGIEAIVEGHAPFGISPRPNDATVKLLKAGVAVGSNLATAASWISNVDLTKTYGGPTNLWGTTWTPTDINNANFGLEFSVNGVGVEPMEMLVDSIKLIVYYSMPPVEIEVENKGDDYASPILYVTGPISESFKIENLTTGELPWYYTNSVASGHVVTIDFRNKTVKDNGVNTYQYYNFPISSWFKLKPGVNKLRLTPNGTTTSATRLQAEFRSTYL